MPSRSWFRRLVVCGFAASLLACATETPIQSLPPDVARAIAVLPRAEVLESADDGVPTFLRGELGHVGPTVPQESAALEVALRPVLVPALEAFRLKVGDLALRKVNADINGNRHLRYQQRL